MKPEIINMASKEPGLQYRGLTIHDPHRAGDEAASQIAALTGETSGLILVLGVGLGYHLLALAERYPAARIMAYEPDAELLETYRAFSSDQPPMGENFELLTGWNEFSDRAAAAIVHGDFPRPVLFIHPAYRGLFPDEVRRFQGIVKAAELRRVVIDKTRKEKSILFAENLARNLPRLLRLPVVTGLKDRWPGIPGFIVGSGPGLAQNGSLLRELNGRGVILAASSAWKPLMGMGVPSAAVVIVEGEDTSRFIRQPAADPGCLLTLASTAHPAHFEVEGFSQAFYHLHSAPAYLMGEDNFVPQAGTAGTAAFTLGLLFGFNPLILVGQDQAFAGDRIHAQGAPNRDQGASSLATFQVSGTDGRTVETHSAFAASLHWYGEAISHLRKKNSHPTIINATESGARIPGIPHVPLAEVMKRLRPKGSPPPDLVRAMHTCRRPDPAMVKERLLATWRLVSQLDQVMRQAPAQGLSLFGEACRTHPFLNFALPVPPEQASPETRRELLGKLEGMLLTMLEAVENA